MDSNEFKKRSLQDLEREKFVLDSNGNPAVRVFTEATSLPYSSVTGNPYDNTALATELNKTTQAPTVSTTEVASQGGLLINIDSAVGDVARTTTGYIEDGKYGFYFSSSAGTSSAEFDSAEKMTGRLVLKLSSVTSDGLGRVSMFFNGTLAGGNTLVPVKPSTKYVLSIPYGAANTASGHTCIVFATNSNVPGSALSARNTTEIPSGTYKRQIVKTTFTTSATDTFIGLQFRMNTPGNISDIFVDVNSMTLEEITEPVTNSLTSKSPSLVGFTAVGSTDNVDQSQLGGVNGATIGESGGLQYVQGQSFTASKSKATGFAFYRSSVVSTLTGNAVLEIRTDNAGAPSSTIIATSSVSSVPNSTRIVWNAPVDLVPGNKYWAVLKSSVTEPSGASAVFVRNGSSTYSGGELRTSSDGGATWAAAGTSDLDFQTLYYKPSTNFTARQNNDVVSISADSDGFLEGAKIDLENGAFSWNSGIGTSEYDTKPYNSAYFRTVGTWGKSTSNRLISGATNAELVYKIPSWVDASVNFLSTDSGGSFVTISASTDGVTYTAIAPAAYDVSAKIPFGSAFLKITANGPNTEAEKLEIKGDFDTSSFKTLYNYPTNQNLYATYVKTLSTATTTATYRATKYGFPAIEFADGVYTYLKVDTTATGSTVAFSTDGTTYTTVADGANIALASTTYPIVYVRSNITANRLYVSSNDYNADSAKDGSLKCNVQYKTLTQGLIYDVQDMQSEISELKAAIAALQSA